MSNQKDNMIRIVRGEDRFAGSSNTDLLLNVNLNGENKNIIEGDRTSLINLDERFNTERQKSGIFRIAGKITNIFNNTISGETSYVPFRNSLYYLDSYNTVTNNSIWKGYPQYDEFAFFRTRGIDGHIPFINKSGTSYNWMIYVTYPSSNKTDQQLRNTTIYPDGSSINNYIVSDGVPYHIVNTKLNGNKLITFYCGYKHNLKVGDWVYLNNEVSGRRLFEVYQLGDKNYGNEDTVFSIFNYGFTDPLFGDYAIGNFKRVLDINNIVETTSKYYVRQHATLTTISQSDIAKMGFERNPFPIKKQLEYASLTPNNTERTSIKDGSQTTSFSFDKDIDISSLKDNLDRPITQLFVTIINRGYMGWFNNPYVNNNSTGVQVGWDFNFQKDSIDPWWSLNNVTNRDNIPTNSYVINGETFYYNESLPTGHTIMGSICEFNDFEQQETVLSEINHKISYNPQIFDNVSDNLLPDGYTYKPHYPIDIRVYSDYIEFGDKNKADGVPDYAFYSKQMKQWMWRDIYDYGYVDTSGNGVDHPFLNGAHYPFKQILFLLTPTKKDNKTLNTVIYSPLEDDCE